MAATRILVVNLPLLLGGIVNGIVKGQRGIEIVDLVRGNDVLKAIESQSPDHILLGGEDEAVIQHVASIRTTYPEVSVVVLDATGRSATAYQSGRAPRRVTDISPAVLLEVLHGAPD